MWGYFAKCFGNKICRYVTWNRQGKKRWKRHYNYTWGANST